MAVVVVLGVGCGSVCVVCVGSGPGESWALAHPGFWVRGGVPPAVGGFVCAVVPRPAVVMVAGVGVGAVLCVSGLWSRLGPCCIVLHLLALALHCNFMLFVWCLFLRSRLIYAVLPVHVIAR